MVPLVHTQVGVHGGNDKVESYRAPLLHSRGTIVEDVAFDTFKDGKGASSGSGIDLFHLLENAIGLHTIGVK